MRREEKNERDNSFEKSNWFRGRSPLFPITGHKSGLSAQPSPAAGTKCLAGSGGGLSV